LRAKVRLSEHKTKEFFFFFVEHGYFRLNYQAKFTKFYSNSFAVSKIIATFALEFQRKRVSVPAKHFISKHIQSNIRIL